MTIRVMLVDDHEVVRQGLATLLGDEDDIAVVSEVGTVGRALAVVRDAAPDVAVLDVHLPDGDGIRLCRRLGETAPDLRCLVLSAFNDDQTIVDAHEAGAVAYLVKELRGVEIVDAIRRIAAGEVLLDSATVRMARERMRMAGGDRLADLTPQERRIFDLIGAGASNREIAEKMHLAEKTVKNYVTVLLSKLGMRRRTEVAALAARLEERERRSFLGR